VDHKPIASKDYPKNLLEFNQFFPDDASCNTYLEKLRWPMGFVCPSCKKKTDYWIRKRGVYLCHQCRHETSVIAGTLFEGTRKSLRQWFIAAWDVTSHKNGASALSIQRALDLKSYETAWAWLHKLRRAMVRPNRDKLVGYVEVDETYVGGEEADVRGRGTNKKAIVAIAVELIAKDKKKIARIRLRRVLDVSEKSLLGFVCDVVEPGSIVSTDGWLSYSKLPKHGFTHQKTVMANAAEPAHILMPHVHRVAALLKRWLLGTHQGSASREHLDYYLDEFTFRFNRRTSRSRGLLFYRLLSQAVQTKPISNSSLFLDTGRGPPKGLRPNHKM